jgi:hypothetical protein
MGERVQIGEEDREGRFDAIALIGIPHEQFAARFGISFTKNAQYEAPGPMAYAAIELRSGTQFLLDHDYDYPQPGVCLSGRVDVAADEQRAEFAEGSDRADALPARPAGEPLPDAVAVPRRTLVAPPSDLRAGARLGDTRPRQGRRSP